MKLFTLIAWGVIAMNATAAEKPEVAKAEPRVFELRTYTAPPGKMKDLHSRFRDHTCKLLEKYGMTLIGFWVPTDAKGAEETLIYIVAHPSEEAAKKAWENFRKDPDWLKAKADSEKNGPIVASATAKFLNPTDYSKIK